MKYYIDPKGGGDFSTLEDLEEYLLNLAKDQAIHVILRKGTHCILRPITLKSNVTLEGEDGAIISGGIRISDWSLFDPSRNIYRSFVGTNVRTRQLFCNGIRGTRARSEGGLHNCATDYATGHTTTDCFLADFKYPQDLEMVYYEQWTNPRCGVEKIEVKDGIATLTMKQPGWSFVTNKGLTSVSTPVYYENAYELLTDEGEWYLDIHEGYLYYIPRFFEDMATAEIILPHCEQLLVVNGTVEKPAENITLQNLTFQYATWRRPSGNGGHSDAQNNHLREKAPDGSSLPDRLSGAAVEMDNVKDITVKDCTFRHLGGAGLKLTGAVQNSVIEGNEFYDISGGAILLGEPDVTDENVYCPKDERYAIQNNRVNNNYIHSIGVEYRSAAGISAGFPADTEFCHNELFDMPYSGFHIGYGWDRLPKSCIHNVKIADNYIHQVMNGRIFDGSAIYALGPTGGSLDDPNRITGNFVTQVQNYHGALYLDEGSSFWEVSHNVVDLSDTPTWYGKGDTPGKPRWIHLWRDSIHHNRIIDNYSTTDEKTNKAVETEFEEPHLFHAENLPTEVVRIRQNAGLEARFAEHFANRLQAAAVEPITKMKTGECLEIAMHAKTLSGESIQPQELHLRNRSPEIVSLCSNMLTALKKGVALIDIAVADGGLLQQFQLCILIQ